MLADDIAVTDAQVRTVRCFEALVQRVRTERGARGDFVTVAEGGPALHIDVRFQEAIRADGDIAFNDAVFADLRPGANYRLRMHARGLGHRCRWINWHPTHDIVRAWPHKCGDHRIKTMRLTLALLISASGLFAQMQMPGGMPGGQPNFQRYQPNYDDVKAALGLSEEQVTKLKQFQQDKMAATQAFYSKMADKQKELNQLLESNSTDAARIGQLMLELQQLRKQPAPGGADIHEKAVEVLTAPQKVKLEKLEEALKMRSAVDQATQLALLNALPPVAPSPVKTGGPMAMPAPVKK